VKLLPQICDIRFSDLQTACRHISVEEPAQRKMRYRASKAETITTVLVNAYELLLAQFLVC